MSTRTTAATRAELAEEASAWAVGGGIVTMALFPLALPIVLLTAAAAIPLLLVAAPILLLRRLIAIPQRRQPKETGNGGAPSTATGDLAHALHRVR